ncbi:MAG: nucleotidyltransferase family protein [Ruminococcus sp.]|nr:nucleotidyltransferase family protein [Ruminococcus sp.]
MKKLNTIQQTVLDLLANELFHANRQTPMDIDWKAVYQESHQQTVHSLVYSALPDDIKNSEQVQKWRDKVMYSLSNNYFFNYEHTQLNKTMESAEIPYVVLKGSVSASYYPNPIMRIMGDVDFLVDKNDMKKADKLLLSKGFKRIASKHEFEKAYYRNNAIWEMHSRVNGVPEGKAGEKINLYLQNVIADAVRIDIDNGYYMRPSTFHHGLIMLVHTARHMITSGIGLRHLCDWAVFVEAIQDEFVDLFEDKLKEVGLWRFAQLLTQLSVVYLGSTPQTWMGEVDEDLLYKLMQDIFDSGNFGHKNMKRSDEAKFITSRKKGSVSDSSVLKQSVLSANEIVRKHWRFADKVPIVYPAGWAYFGGRYYIRYRMGKRKKIEVKGLIEGATDRKELYKQMRLYEE